MTQTDMSLVDQIKSIQRSVSLLRDQQQDQRLKQQALTNNVNTIKHTTTATVEILQSVKQMIQHEAKHNQQKHREQTEMIVSQWINSKTWYQPQMLWENFVRSFPFMSLDVIRLYVPGAPVAEAMYVAQAANVNLCDYNSVHNHLKQRCAHLSLDIPHISVHAATIGIININRMFSEYRF